MEWSHGCATRQRNSNWKCDAGAAGGTGFGQSAASKIAQSPPTWPIEFVALRPLATGCCGKHEGHSRSVSWGRIGDASSSRQRLAAFALLCDHFPAPWQRRSAACCGLVEINCLVQRYYVAYLNAAVFGCQRTDFAFGSWFTCCLSVGWRVRNEFVRWSAFMWPCGPDVNLTRQFLDVLL